MRNVKLALKLALGFGLVLILTGVVAFVGYNGLNTVGGSVDIADDANRMVKYILECRRQEKNFMLRGFTVLEGDTQNAVEKLDAVVAGFETQIEETKAKLIEQEGIAIVVEVGRHLADYKAAFDKYVSLARQGEEAETQMVEEARAVLEVVEEMHADQKEELYAEVDRGEDTATIRDRKVASGCCPTQYSRV